MKIMAIWLGMVGILIVMVMQTGCTAMHVIERDRQIIRAKDVVEIKTGWEDGWEARVGIDVAKAAQLKTGFWAALTEDTKGTLGAIAVDAVLAGGAYYLMEKSKDNEPAPVPQEIPQYSIQANNVIIGDNNGMTFNGGQ